MKTVKEAFEKACSVCGCLCYADWVNDDGICRLCDDKVVSE